MGVCVCLHVKMPLLLYAPINDRENKMEEMHKIPWQGCGNITFDKIIRKGLIQNSYFLND